MKQRHPRARIWNHVRWTLSAICLSALISPGAGVTFAEEGATAAQPSAKTEGTAATQPSAKPDSAAADKSTEKLVPERLEALVAPIALYPDDLLTQTLVASTYPLEIVQLQQWLAKHKDLKDKALVDAVAKEPWDPSIQSMAGIPEVVNRLANDIQWTTDLGNAFLAQQADVMDAVQRMRKKAQDKGALKTNEQQKVETKVVEEKTVIIVESANPEVVYVPSYSPVVVYGPPLYYPYPPIYYPSYPPGAAFVSFSFGVMWGAAWGGSCCHYGWGGNDVNIDIDNNFNQINHNRGDGNRGQGGGRGQGGSWKHNPEHRGAAPYGDRATASKYGGSARGDSAANRAGQTGGGARASNRAGGGGGAAGVSDRSASGGRGGAGPSTADRGGSGGAGSRGGGDSIGNRSVPSSGSSRGSSGFSGGSRGYSGSSARASSSRGYSSMGSRGGGGRGGGGRGGRR